MHPYQGSTLSTTIDISTAIQPRLRQSLQEAVILCSQSLSTVESPLLADALKNIPLHQAKDANRILYISAIAFLLAKTCNQPAIEIATAIAAHLSSSSAGLDFTVQVFPPGWLHLQMADLGLANWLQSFTQQSAWGLLHKESEFVPAYPVPVPPTCDSASLFAVQYAHARGCSLLQLAHREGIITLSPPNPQTNPPSWGAIAPDPIPWLWETPQGDRASSSLRLVHPAERRLISQLVTTLDALSHPRADGLKLATALSQAFETFYRACRIWGEVKTESPYLAQARLGLILATQSVLGQILQNFLGVCAPLEL